MLIPGTAAVGQRAAVVGVDKVRSEIINQTYPVIGRLVARRAGVVAARVEGPVAEMRVEVGDRVAKGAVIAVLVSDTLAWTRERRAANVAQQEAKLAAANAKLQLKRQELRRLEKLRREIGEAAAQLARRDRQQAARHLKQGAEELQRMAVSR